MADVGVRPDCADLERRGRRDLYLAEPSRPAAPAAQNRHQAQFHVLELRPFGRGHGFSPGPHPFVPMSAISALLESCSSAPAARPLPSRTHSKFDLDQFDIAEAAGRISTGPNRLQRLYNGRCQQLVAPDGLKLAPAPAGPKVSVMSVEPPARGLQEE